ncbi:class I adenylate-forming enzyme family protein [Domibacillus enclensis]|uniref:Acyl-CoA synthetase (AMP-forming)/AMP-acid ligase II n=1 Tax=Domibacillus enclensis TaxID=1017273 RepID=A0A1N7AAZ5_9BACI|nr:fatty acid--CoA ligase family protein [Domibacillus enclensis]OXS75758.1 hypothetical protein B1B05_14600 [Domibacillus enclensis]SIR36216.1 Acyl-CoA synthetase (AMP-forming)/AMP-acid ligase II [Domibacillus enclensis]
MSNLYKWLMEKEVDENKVLLTTQSGSFTFKNITDEVDQYSEVLNETGSVTRKRFALIVPNVLSYMSLSLAISRLNGVIIPISPMLRKEDLTSILSFINPHFIFSIEQHNGIPFSEIIHEWAKEERKETVIFTSGNSVDWNCEKISGEKRLDEQNEKLDMIGCTSGSTGVPKGIMAGQEFVEFAARALREMVSMKEQDQFFLMAPVSGLFGLCWLLTAFQNRNHITITESFHFPDMMDLMRKSQANKLITSPSLYKAVYLLDQSREEKALKKIEFVSLAGENISLDFIESVAQVKDCTLTSGYGLSEIGAMMYTEKDIRNGIEWTLVPDVEYKLEKEEGAGELHFKTKCGFMGYYGNVQLDKEVYHDGWFNTGDLAQLTPEQKIMIVGRKKDMIKKGGQQVIPGEVEKVLCQHPSVHQAVVVGVPHKIYGEKIVAFMTAEKELSFIDITSFCSEKIARFKVPDEFYQLDEIPLIQGKVDKVTLRQRASEYVK